MNYETPMLAIILAIFVTTEEDKRDSVKRKAIYPNVDNKS